MCKTRRRNAIHRRRRPPQSYWSIPEDFGVQGFVTIPLEEKLAEMDRVRIHSVHESLVSQQSNLIEPLTERVLQEVGPYSSADFRRCDAPAVAAPA
jgi:hypothetical protein